MTFRSCSLFFGFCPLPRTCRQSSLPLSDRICCFITGHESLVSLFFCTSSLPPLPIHLVVPYFTHSPRLARLFIIFYTPASATTHKSTVPVFSLFVFRPWATLLPPIPYHLVLSLAQTYSSFCCIVRFRRAGDFIMSRYEPHANETRAKDTR